MPRDVHVLPGQLKDVVEAMGDHRNTPPPLPTLPRPQLPNTPDRHNGTYRSQGSDNSDGSGSFRSHLTRATVHRPQLPPSQAMEQHRSNAMASASNNAESGTVNNLRQLYRRQTDLAMKAIVSDMNDENDNNVGYNDRGIESNSNDDNYDDDIVPSSTSSMVWSEFSFGKPPESSRSKSQNQPKLEPDNPEIEAPIHNPLGHLFQSPSESHGNIGQPSLGRPPPDHIRRRSSPERFGRQRSLSPPASPVSPPLPTPPYDGETSYDWRSSQPLDYPPPPPDMTSHRPPHVATKPDMTARRMFDTPRPPPHTFQEEEARRPAPLAYHEEEARRPAPLAQQPEPDVSF